MKYTVIFFVFSIILCLALGWYTFDQLNIHKDGTVIEYFDDGTTRSQTTYKNGKPHGEAKVFFKTGGYKRIVTFKNGKQDGKTITYYHDGKIRSEEVYKENILNGFSRFYKKDGSLQWEAEFKDGITIDSTFRDFTGRFNAKGVAQ